MPKIDRKLATDNNLVEFLDIVIHYIRGNNAGLGDAFIAHHKIIFKNQDSPSCITDDVLRKISDLSNLRSGFYFNINDIIEIVEAKYPTQYDQDFIKNVLIYYVDEAKQKELSDIAQNILVRKV
jgi:hypothetical protein